MIKLLLSGVLACAAMLGAPPAASQQAAWLSKLEGLYIGQNNPTPFGRIGFAMDMMKKADGAMHGRVQRDRETYFDFKFWPNEKGEILFRETGALPGGFVQSYELEMVKAEGDTLTFETKKYPGVLVAQVTADGDRLRVNAVVRGKPHVDLNMARVRDEKIIAGFRTEQARAKELPAGSALKQFFAASAAGQIDSKLPKPEQARLHVGEAQKIGGQMSGADAAEIPGLAFRMKGHLDKAIELDSTFDQAHFGLAMWYLQAPGLAGGSKEKAREILGKLEKLNSPLAEVLRTKLGDGAR